MTAKETLSDTPPSPVGAGLLAKAPGQPTSLSNDTPHSRAGSLPQDDRNLDTVVRAIQESGA